MMMTEKQKKQRQKNVLYAFKMYCSDTGKSLEILDVIGEGGCSIIYEVRNKRTGETVVLKAIDTALAEIDCSVSQMDKYAREEIRALKILKGHKNIIQLIDAYYCPVDVSTGEMVYLMFLPKLELVTTYFKKKCQQ